MLEPIRAPLTPALPALLLADYGAEHPVALWLRNKQRVNTQATYARAVAGFAAFLHTERGKDDLMAADFADVLEWRERLAAPTAAGSPAYHSATIVAKMRALSALYGHLVTVGVIARNPCAAVDIPEISDARFKRSWRLDELLAFMAAIPTAERPGLPPARRLQYARDRALFWLLFRNGLRVSEAIGARVGDLQETEGERVLLIREHGAGDQHVKGGRMRYAVLKRETAATLDGYLALRGYGPGGVIVTHPATGGPMGGPTGGDWRDAPLFAVAAHRGRSTRAESPTGERALGRRVVVALMHAYATEAGIDPEIAHPHAARMTAIMALIRAGVDLQAVMAFSGHRTLRAVQAYFDRATLIGENAALRMPY